MSISADDDTKIETQNVIALEDRITPAAFNAVENAPSPHVSDATARAITTRMNRTLSPKQGQMISEVATLLQQCADANARQIKATAIAAVICAILCLGVMHLALTAVTQNQTRTASFLPEPVLSKASPLDSFAKMENAAHDTDHTVLEKIDELASPPKNSALEQFLRWHSESDSHQK